MSVRTHEDLKREDTVSTMCGVTMNDSVDSRVIADVMNEKGSVEVTFYPAMIRIDPVFTQDADHFFFDVLPEYIHEQHFLVLEIGIETAHGNTGCRSNFLGIGAVKTVLGKLILGCYKDAVFGFDASFLLGNPGFLLCT